MEYKTLNNGVQIPSLGFGVYQIPAEQTKTAVLQLLGLVSVSRYGRGLSK